MTTAPASTARSTEYLRLQIEYVAPSTLTPAANRTRLHTKAKIKALARSIVDHGLLIPIRVNAEARVIGGHALLEAAVSLKAAEALERPA